MKKNKSKALNMATSSHPVSNNASQGPGLSLNSITSNVYGATVATPAWQTVNTSPMSGTFTISDVGIMPVPTQEIMEEIKVKFPYNTTYATLEDLRKYIAKSGLNEGIDYKTLPGYNYVWFIDQNDLDRFHRHVMRQSYRARMANDFKQFLKQKYEVSTYRKNHNLKTRIKVYPAQDRFDDMYYEIMDFYGHSGYDLPDDLELFSKAMFVPELEGYFVIFLKDQGDAAMLKTILLTKELVDEVEFY